MTAAPSVERRLEPPSDALPVHPAGETKGNRCSTAPAGGGAAHGAGDRVCCRSLRLIRSSPSVLAARERTVRAVQRIVRCIQRIVRAMQRILRSVPRVRRSFARTIRSLPRTIRSLQRMTRAGERTIFSMQRAVRSFQRVVRSFARIVRERKDRADGARRRLLRLRPRSNSHESAEEHFGAESAAARHFVLGQIFSLTGKCSVCTIRRDHRGWWGCCFRPSSRKKVQTWTGKRYAGRAGRRYARRM